MWGNLFYQNDRVIGVPPHPNRAVCLMETSYIEQNFLLEKDIDLLLL